MSERKHDFIPRNAGQFNEFMLRIVETASEKFNSTPKKWDHFPKERLNALTAKYTVFSGKYHAALNDPTHANIVARQEAQAEAEHELRGFISQYLRFPPVTNAERADLSIPNHDKTRTDHVTVPETVEFEIHLKNIRELIIDFKVKGASGKAKPDGYDGAVLIWGVRAEPPSKPEDLDEHILASRTPFTLHFDEGERGKTAWVAACWQNGRGFEGEYSEYKNAVIP